MLYFTFSLFIHYVQRRHTMDQHTLYNDTENRRLAGKVTNIYKKIARSDSDIKFFTQCKKCGAIPTGLKVKNPLRNTFNSDYAENICKNTSRRLLNHLIHRHYGRKKLLLQKSQELLSGVDEQCKTDIVRISKAAQDKCFAELLVIKNRKLQKNGN